MSHHHNHNHHSHGHGHGHHHHDYSHVSASNLRVATLLNLVFSILEFIGGALFNSTAILSDAVHDLGDALILVFSLILEKTSKRPANQKYSYGYKRLSLVGAIINSVVLLSGTIFIFTEAFQKLFKPEFVNSGGIFLMSIFGIAANFIAAMKLNGAKNILDRSVFAHLLEDLLGWVAVFITSIVIFFTNWYILDSILSIVIGLIVLRNVISNIITSYRIIMHRTPSLSVLKKIKSDILALHGIESIHDVHFWTLDNEHHVFTAKIHTHQPSEALRHDISHILEHYHVIDSTIEWISHHHEH
ncbi:cation transporter [Carnobacteriaceae bacterium zg-ZUI78]|nr:cation transporter [Carnobacteriaceae bacterium zg-ZUI78]